MSLNSYLSEQVASARSVFVEVRDGEIEVMAFSLNCSQENMEFLGKLAATGLILDCCMSDELEPTGLTEGLEQMLLNYLRTR